MKKPPPADDMGTGIARTIIGYALIIAGLAIFTILAVAASCKL